MAGWLILITNAPVEKLPTEAMSYLYRVRWQIELVFKQCKSVLRLDVTLARTNAYRMQCEILARLIAAVVLSALVAFLAFGQTADLTILATSDLHNNYLNYDYFSDLPTEAYGLVKLATAVKAERDAKGNPKNK